MIEAVPIEDKKETEFLETGTKVAMALIIVTMIVLASSLALPWCDVNLKAKIAGGSLLGENLTVNADLHVYTYGINYSATGADRNMSGDITLYEGLGGELGSVMGLLKGSKKEQTYTITTANWDAEAKVDVKTEVALVPYWPSGIEQDVTITVSLETTEGIFDHVNVNEVWLELWGGWNEGAKQYTRKAVIWKELPGTRMARLGDSVSFKVPKGFKGEDAGERYALIGMANVTMVDQNDAEDIIQTTGIGSNFRPSIQVWPMSPYQTFSIFGLAMALPLVITGIVTCVIGFYFALKQRRKTIYFPLASGVMSALAVVLFINGITALVGLVGLTTETVWTPYAFIPLLAAVISFIALFILYSDYKAKYHKETGFREIEVVKEETVIICPGCGAAIAPDMEHCQTCGKPRTSKDRSTI